MRVLLTGATGYIGMRLLPVLIQKGFIVVCCVRDKNRFNPPESFKKNIEVVEVDFLKEETLHVIPKNIDGAFYLIHSMTYSNKFENLEKLSAINFRNTIENTAVKHVVYLSGIINQKSLSKHLQSRKTVEDELSKGRFNLTTLRAGIVIGSGSASFEIIRDLVEKLPVMIAPRWLLTKSQPIGIREVILFLQRILFKEFSYNKSYDIGGPDVLNYKEMLLGFATARGLKRKIFIVPVMTPRLSSYWLFFMTSTSYRLSVNLVDSMKVEVICRSNDLYDQLGIQSVSYEESLKRTLKVIEANQIISSWKDSFASGRLQDNISEFIKVPSFGVLKDTQKVGFNSQYRDNVIDRIWQIGGDTGWYYANLLWKIRGFLDQILGGVGLRRGRTHKNQINIGDAIDFWRVIYANKEEGRLLLYAEMKLPGEAWLEFKFDDSNFIQEATFRPKGLAGRLYWYVLLPIHLVIFKQMANRIVKG